VKDEADNIPPLRLSRHQASAMHDLFLHPLRGTLIERLSTAYCCMLHMYLQCVHDLGRKRHVGSVYYDSDGSTNGVLIDST
jgi:hypothetical protein